MTKPGVPGTIGLPSSNHVTWGTGSPLTTQSKVATLPSTLGTINFANEGAIPNPNSKLNKKLSTKFQTTKITFQRVLFLYQFDSARGHSTIVAGATFELDGAELSDSVHGQAASAVQMVLHDISAVVLSRHQPLFAQVPHNVWLWSPTHHTFEAEIVELCSRFNPSRL